MRSKKEGVELEDMIKEYLRKHLRITIDHKESTVRVRLYFDDEIISESTYLPW